MKEIYKKITVGMFMGILIVISMATLLLPKKDFSELENRQLQSAPQLSAEALLDKTFMTKEENFLADHLVFRDSFASFKTRFEMLLGKKLVNNVFITNEMLLENVEGPKKGDTITPENTKAIEGFATKYKDRLQTVMMLVPTASEIYKNKLPPLAEQFDQAAYIKDVYKQLPSVSTVDAYSALSASANEDIYYRTDHHWTSLGAYVGYNALAKNLRYKPVAIDLFEIEHASHDFLGTLFSKVVYGEDLKDGIDLYHYAKEELVTDVVRYTPKNTQTFSSIFFKDNLQAKDKYTVFLGQNNAVLKIKTNVGNGKKLLVFKDSYAHSIMQFLPLHYDEIVMIDTRYLNEPLSKYVNINEFKEALFLYNVSGFVADSSVKKVSLY